ncbi:histidine kinase [Obesumbacterium proteus]|nr:histidine kinase [Obesumbacterium proteus]
MKPYFPMWLQQSFILLLWGLIFYLAGLTSLRFDDPESSIAIIWFPAGIAVAAFLSARWRDYPALIIIFTLANVLLDEEWKSPLTFAISVLYSFLSIPSTVIIAWVVRRFARLNDDLHIILVWIMATLVISALDSFVVGGGFAFVHDVPFIELFWQGFVADITGIFFATPIVMGFINKNAAYSASNRVSKTIGFTLWLVLCATAGVVFGHELPWVAKHATALYFGLACLPIAIVMMICIFWGNLGGSVALLTLGAIVIYFTDQHQGPFFQKSLTYTESLFLALSYLSATTLLVVFIRVVRRSTRNHDPETGRIVGNGVFYRLNASSGAFVWENDLALLLGHLEPGAFDLVDDVLQRVHPRDREKLRTHWLSCSQDKRGSMIFRIQALNGQWVTLVDKGSMRLVSDGEDIIVGNWQASRYHLAL